MKPIYIVGTHRDVGKTTMSIGLAHAFGRHGLDVGYLKPLGQRVKGLGGHVIHDDANLVSACLGRPDITQQDMAIPLPSGVVEREIKDLHSDELLQRVTDSYNTMAARHDVVIVEAMGNVAMGSCLGLSAADVAAHIGAPPLLVAIGGIGKTIDYVSLCATFLSARGAGIMGVVVNKVWPEKYDRVKIATTQGLKNLGITSFGTVPFDRTLASPTMEQVHAVIGGEIIAGADRMSSRVHNAIVAAMDPEHMVEHLKEQTLVITPGDRGENILACLEAHASEAHEFSLAGMILTGGYLPDEQTTGRLVAADIPVVSCQADTYAVASTYGDTVFKTRPEDTERIQAAYTAVSRYVDVEAILARLKD